MINKILEELKIFELTAKKIIEIREAAKTLSKSELNCTIKEAIEFLRKTLGIQNEPNNSHELISDLGDDAFSG